MINWEEFNNQYKYFGNELVVLLIELFINGDENEKPPSPSYDERISSITDAISHKDYAGIKFHAHSLKGVVANFYDPESKELAGILEWMGTQYVDDGSSDEAKKAMEELLTSLNNSLSEKGVDNTDEGMKVIFEMLKISAEKLLVELKQHLKTIS
jgi:HPt (histidine-containing phosphotransfer) domain-containing protein